VKTVLSIWSFLVILTHHMMDFGLKVTTGIMHPTIHKKLVTLEVMKNSIYINLQTEVIGKSLRKLLSLQQLFHKIQTQVLGLLAVMVTKEDILALQDLIKTLF